MPIPTDLRQGATDPHGYAVQGTSHPVISESVVQSTHRLRRTTSDHQYLSCKGVGIAPVVACRDRRSAPAPARLGSGASWILGPRGGMSIPCSGPRAGRERQRGQSLAREDRRPHHAHIALVFRRARHCHLLATRHTVMLCFAPSGARRPFPVGSLSIGMGFFVPPRERTRVNP